MDKNTVRAYLMQEVIILGFSPSGSNERKNWLLQYGKSLKSFWEVDAFPQLPKQNGHTFKACIDISKSIDFTYDYSIEESNKFSVTLLHEPNNLMWTHDMDIKYFSFPYQRFLTAHNQRKEAIKAMSENDFASVIDALIMHPTPHQHIASPIDQHEIRIGGGIGNPFLYLFHLRIQLCPIKEKRHVERSRLIAIFSDAIKNNKPIVTANDLMYAS